MRIGFIGLGVMGRPMALNLMAAGHSMAVYARRPAVLQPLVTRGAIAHATPASVAAASDVVFTMVTGTSDVQEVVFGQDGIAQGAGAGALVVDMSTAAPDATRRWAARLAGERIEMLDAPVTGGPEGARNATLTIMVGGNPGAFARALPLLKCLGETVRHMGGNGAGQATKACNQVAQLVAVQGVAEALTLAKRYGLDPGLVQQTLMTGLAGSRVLELFGKRMVERDFEAGIKTRLYHKDLQMVLELADALGCRCQAAALTLEHLSLLMSRGFGENDLSTLITIVEERPNANTVASGN